MLKEIIISILKEIDKKIKDRGYSVLLRSDRDRQIVFLKYLECKDKNLKDIFSLLQEGENVFFYKYEFYPILKNNLKSDSKKLNELLNYKIYNTFIAEKFNLTKERVRQILCKFEKEVEKDIVFLLEQEKDKLLKLKNIFAIYPLLLLNLYSIKKEFKNFNIFFIRKVVLFICSLIGIEYILSEKIDLLILGNLNTYIKRKEKDIILFYEENLYRNIRKKGAGIKNYLFEQNFRLIFKDIYFDNTSKELLGILFVIFLFWDKKLNIKNKFYPILAKDKIVPKIFLLKRNINKFMYYLSFIPEGIIFRNIDFVNFYSFIKKEWDLSFSLKEIQESLNFDKKKFFFSFMMRRKYFGILFDGDRNYIYFDYVFSLIFKDSFINFLNNEVLEYILGKEEVKVIDIYYNFKEKFLKFYIGNYIFLREILYFIAYSDFLFIKQKFYNLIKILKSKKYSKILNN